MEITAEDVLFIDSGSDSGPEFRCKCPECGGIIYVAERQWWTPECDCGYKWSLEIKVVGYRADEQVDSVDEVSCLAWVSSKEEE